MFDNATGVHSTFVLWQVWAIFGDNLFERPLLLGTFKELLGPHSEGHMKPLECVGTPDEVLLCLHLAKTRYVKGDWTMPCALKELDCTSGAKFDRLLSDTNHDTLAPVWFKP